MDHGFSEVISKTKVFELVEIAAIQLKELDQQDAKVDVGTLCVDPRV